MSRIAAIRAQIEERLPGAFTLYDRPEHEFIRTGIPAVDQHGGIPRSALTQFCAPAGISSGKTTVLLSLMAQLTQESHFCALVDATNSFDPESAEGAGVDLSHALWVRCSEKQTLKPIEQAFKAADILLHNGGFALIAVDLGDIEERLVKKVPLSTWFRFKRVVERMPTALLFLMTCPAAQSCATLTLRLNPQRALWTGAAAVSHANLISRLSFDIDVEQTRVRKQVRSATSVAPARFGAR
jgi:hypothetical protein